jgi:homopolymeric O-antigen transport system ATP-binding protein
MNEIAIKVQHLSKQYKIRFAAARHDTLRDEIAYGFKSLFRRNGRPATLGDPSALSNSFWAIKDVSFEVKKGEVLGIIGRNGAGKSTLLKILSRVTEPTEGEATIHGRVGSLLEVGTGFHGELTGRENIYLNGAILGMKKAEIDRKFDEIVAFAEVEKFIDTPVKRYSSGMHVRLAFAVAAHLETEILIVDEVLAVGDASFQKKCLGKMGKVSREGRTILFVSHNMGALSNLCTTGLWIHNGQTMLKGEVTSVVNAYIKSLTTTEQADSSKARRSGNWTRTGTPVLNILNGSLLDSSGRECTTFSMGESIVLEFDVEFYHSVSFINFTLEISRTEMGMRVLHLQSDDTGSVFQQIPKGERRFRVEISNCLLYPANYEMHLCVWSQAGVLDYVEAISSFSMIQSNVTKRTQPLTTHKQAIFYTPSVWSEVPLDATNPCGASV